MVIIHQILIASVSPTLALFDLLTQDDGHPSEMMKLTKQMNKYVR